MVSQGLALALFSGFLAAVASVLGKVAMARDDAQRACLAIIDAWWLNVPHELVEAIYMCQEVLLYVQGALFVLMIACNTLMWTVFTRALRLSSATLEVTVVNLAANFFSSAIFGQVFFAEKLSPLWFVGTVFIVLGLALMHIGNCRSEERKRALSARGGDQKYPGSRKIYERHKARNLD